MTDFERELQQALRRVDPPAGFAERVLSRARPVSAPPKPGFLAGLMSGWPRWAMAAAAAVVMVTGGVRYQHYREGQHAKEQVLLALRITAEKIAVAHHKLDQVSQRSGERE